MFAYSYHNRDSEYLARAPIPSPVRRLVVFGEFRTREFNFSLVVIYRSSSISYLILISVQKTGIPAKSLLLAKWKKWDNCSTIYRMTLKDYNPWSQDAPPQLQSARKSVYVHCFGSLGLAHLLIQLLQSPI